MTSTSRQMVSVPKTVVRIGLTSEEADRLAAEPARLSASDQRCTSQALSSEVAVKRLTELLKALARAVRTVDRRLQPLHWHRQPEDAETPEPMHGLLGTVRFEGPVGPLLPLLRAATRFHVGKLTGFGLGRIALELGR